MSISVILIIFFATATIVVLLYLFFSRKTKTSKSSPSKTGKGKSKKFGLPRFSLTRLWNGIFIILFLLAIAAIIILFLKAYSALDSCSRRKDKTEVVKKVEYDSTLMITGNFSLPVDLNFYYRFKFKCSVPVYLKFPGVPGEILDNGKGSAPFVSRKNGYNWKPGPIHIRPVDETVKTAHIEVWRFWKKEN